MDRSLCYKQSLYNCIPCLELAENLRELGMDVTIVQRPKQLMNEMEYRTIGSALAGGYRAAVYCRLSKDEE